MSLIWSNDERELLNGVRSTMSTSEVERFFDLLGYERSQDSIQKMSKRMGVRFEGYGLIDEEYFNEADEIEAYRQVIAERNKCVEQVAPPPYVSSSEMGNHTKQLKDETVKMLEQLREIREDLPRSGSNSFVTAPVSSGKDSVVLVLSDWHMGQVVVDPMENKQIYNAEIAKQRILDTPRMLAGKLGNLDGFDEVVVCMCGDMVTGEGIFPGQEWSTEYHAADQVLNVTKTAWKLIQDLREMFPLVRIATTRGNHGRSGGSPEANWDNIVYQQLELLVDLEDDSNLTIYNRYGDYTIVNVKGWRGMLRHTAPIQSDTASAVAKFAGWFSMHDCDFLCYGHYHHWGVMPWMGKPIIRNGCLVGGDDYAEGLAKNDRPSQVAFTVSEDEVAEVVIPLYY